MNHLIEVKNLIFDYFRKDEDGNVESIVEALSDINLEVNPGDFISIVGANGSGKSTFAKHLNALLLPTEGAVVIDGRDTRQQKNWLEIRKNAGLVFQNPDNQMVGTTLEADIAFGPENLGVEQSEIERRVCEALTFVGLIDERFHPVSTLSGGQKQKAAIAGVLAMKPKCMILDEATSMLDPKAREQVMQVVHDLNVNQHMTIIHITHFMEEIEASDYVYAMSEGKLVFTGTPAQLFERQDILKLCSLEMPLTSRLRHIFNLPSSQTVQNKKEHRLTKEQEIAQTVNLIAKKGGRLRRLDIQTKSYDTDIEHALIFDHVTYRYKKISSLEPKNAVCDASFLIRPGEFVGIAGHTGSGKSTLLQLMNGLLKPAEGTVYFKGQDIWDKAYPMQQLRRQVGLVFQYPEHQLFGETVYKDVVFGPCHMNVSKLEAQKRAFDAIRDMGLSEDCYDISPFALSGGQMRRVAIAGILAMQPEFLVLDEPTAGLDPAGRTELMQYISDLRSKRNITVIFVSHSMEEMAEYTDRLIVLRQGHIVMDDTTRNCFMHDELMRQAGLKQPIAMQVNKAFAKAGYNIQPDLIRQKELLQALENTSGQDNEII